MKPFLYLKLFSLLLISFFFIQGLHASADPKLLMRLQPYVISIKSRSVVAAYGDVTSATGTGFIADIKNGYVFTNAHVANAHKVVVEYLATTYNGREIPLVLIYSDPSADVAIFRGDFSSLGLKDNLIFHPDLVKAGTNVLIIGKNENRHFSTQTGVVANPYEIEGSLPQQAMRISLNVQGGGSGSLVYDLKEKKVIGIIFASNLSTSAFALPICYGLDILKKIQNDQEVKRFGLGALLEYISLDDLKKYYGFDEKDIEEYAKKYPDAFNRALRVNCILPDSPAELELEVGDVILGINGKQLGPNLYLLDHTVNEAGAEGKDVIVSIVRYGKKMDISLKPYDMTKRSVQRLVVFGGATFFEADDVMIRRSGLKGRNRVLVTNARLGSAFIEKLPIFPGSNQALVCIEKLGDFSINSLDDVIKAIPELIKKGHFTIMFRNYGIKIGYDEKILFNQSRQVESISLYSQDGPADVYTFDKQQHRWDVTQINY